MTWEPEEDELQTEACENVSDFLAAVHSDGRDIWLKRFFNEAYPLDLPDAIVIGDIYSRAAIGKSYEVLRCSQCGRIYIQSDLLGNVWNCYEPRPNQ